MKNNNLIKWTVGCSAGLTMTVALAAAVVSSSQPTSVSHANALEKMPRDLEVRFALSALPTHLREKATVLVLDPAKGYELDRKGTNGFTCIVERTEWRKSDHRNDIYTPMCYDEAGRNNLQVWIDVAGLRAAGKSAAEVKQEVLQRYESGQYHAPKQPGLSYMVAPMMRTYINEDSADHTVMSMPMPHVMYYAPGLTNALIGSMPTSMSYPFPIIFEQGPHGYMIQLIGSAERAKIVESEAALLKDLCAYRTELCLQAPPSGGNGSGGHPHH